MELKSRSEAVKNVGQITKAMEVVAAVKMRKAQGVALETRPYAFAALELLEKLSRYGDVRTPLAEKRNIENTLLVIVASDKGLTGSFNTQVFRAADKFIGSDEFGARGNHKYYVAAVGRKSVAYAERKRLNIAGKFEGFGDYVKPDEVRSLADFVVTGFNEKKWDRVIAISTHFRTAFKQDVMLRQLLPVDVFEIRKTAAETLPEHGLYSKATTGEEYKIGFDEIDYLFEPAPSEIYQSLIPHLIVMQVYHLILEANASEHSTRRVAMKTASDNADELLKNLTLEYNKIRQASITKELIEITSTQNALGK